MAVERIGPVLGQVQLDLISELDDALGVHLQLSAVQLGDGPLVQHPDRGEEGRRPPVDRL